MCPNFNITNDSSGRRSRYTGSYTYRVTDEATTVSTDDIDTESIFESLAEELEDELTLSWNTDDEDEIDHGSESPDNMNNWWLDEAYARRDEAEVGAAYAGEVYPDCNGFGAIKKLALEDVADEIESLIESGDTGVGSFNTATNHWPHEARVIGAYYEVEEAGRDDDDYVEKARNFAESSAVSNIFFTSSELDTFYPENPYEELSQREARTVMKVRALHGIPSRDFLGEVEDHQQFCNDLEDVENVDVALRINRFDNTVPRSVLADASPPDEWDTNPQRIEDFVCDACGNRLYGIETTPGEVEWVSENTVEDGGYLLNEASHLTPNSDNFEFICQHCYDEYSAGAVSVTAIYPEEDIYLQFEVNRYYVEHEEDHDMLPPRYAQDAYQIGNPRDSPPDTYFAIEPNTALGPTPDQIDAINYIADNPDEIDAGPIFVTTGPSLAVIYVERDNIEAAEAAKTAIENNV